MASRYCDDCLIYYPPSELTCLVCRGSNLYTGQYNADDDWRTQVANKSSLAAGILPGVPSTNLVKHSNETWIANGILIECGYPDPQVGDIIRVVGYTTDLFFEIDARARRLNGQPSDTPTIKGWWIHRVDHEGWVPDVIPEEA